MGGRPAGRQGERKPTPRIPVYGRREIWLGRRLLEPWKKRLQARRQVPLFRILIDQLPERLRRAAHIALGRLRRPHVIQRLPRQHAGRRRCVDRLAEKLDGPIQIARRFLCVDALLKQVGYALRVRRRACQRRQRSNPEFIGHDHTVQSRYYRIVTGTSFPGEAILKVSEPASSFWAADSGGLYAAQAFRKAPVDVTLIDRRNFHLFQPLLYQVATGSLSPGEISAPLRGVLSKQKNMRVLMGEASDIDPRAQRVTLKDGGVFEYDSLLVSTGSKTSYFGNEGWRDCAPSLKTIEEATAIRHKILYAFEAAERVAGSERTARSG